MLPGEGCSLDLIHRDTCSPSLMDPSAMLTFDFCEYAPVLTGDTHISLFGFDGLSLFFLSSPEFTFSHTLHQHVIFIYSFLSTLTGL